jgi:hypothetical protein
MLAEGLRHRISIALLAEMGSGLGVNRVVAVSERGTFSEEAAAATAAGESCCKA